MSLATRCPACGTVFRVVPDQLKVSEGWVRCGRCNSMFSAAGLLFDIDSGLSVRLPGFAQSARPRGEEPSITDWTGPSDEPVSRPRVAATPARRPGGPSQRQEPRFDPDVRPGLLRAPSSPSNDEDLRKRPISQPRQDRQASPASAAKSTSAPELPAFLKAADRSARWQRPAVRSTLGAAVLLLALTLLTQLALVWRDTLAAHLPSTEPTLRGLCELAGCQVHPLRRIETLAVASSGLTRVEGSTLYRLQLVLQNRADTAVKIPALDLTLNGGQGQLLARRVLQLSDLGTTQLVLQAGEELPLKVLMSTGERRVEGYTVELFYP
jgi:predicted Zn finger-like uncharacterized protein